MFQKDFIFSDQMYKKIQNEKEAQTFLQVFAIFQCLI